MIESIQAQAQAIQDAEKKMAMEDRIQEANEARAARLKMEADSAPAKKLDLTGAV